MTPTPSTATLNQQASHLLRATNVIPGHTKTLEHCRISLHSGPWLLPVCCFPFWAEIQCNGCWGWTWMNMVKTHETVPRLCNHKSICHRSGTGVFLYLPKAIKSVHEMPRKYPVHALVQAAAKHISLVLFPPTSLVRVRPWGSRWVSVLSASISATNQEKYAGYTSSARAHWQLPVNLTAKFQEDPRRRNVWGHSFSCQDASCK